MIRVNMQVFTGAVQKKAITNASSVAINGCMKQVTAAWGGNHRMDWNIAAKPQEERDKVNVDLAASGVAYKERLNMPVIAEVVMREQPEHLRDYFLERLKFYREKSITLPKGSDPVYLKQEEGK